MPSAKFPGHFKLILILCQRYSQLTQLMSGWIKCRQRGESHMKLSMRNLYFAFRIRTSFLSFGDWKEILTFEQLLSSFLEKNLWFCFAKDVKRSKITRIDLENLVLQRNRDADRELSKSIKTVDDIHTTWICWKLLEECVYELGPGMNITTK